MVLEVICFIIISSLTVIFAGLYGHYKDESVYYKYLLKENNIEYTPFSKIKDEW